MEEFYWLYEDTVKWFHDEYLQIELCREIKGNAESLGFVQKISMTKNGIIEYESKGGILILEGHKIHLRSFFEEFEFETELYRHRIIGNTEYSAKGYINDEDDSAESEEVWSLSFYQTHQECFPFEIAKRKRMIAK